MSESDCRAVLGISWTLRSALALACVVGLACSADRQESSDPNSGAEVTRTQRATAPTPEPSVPNTEPDPPRIDAADATPLCKATELVAIRLHPTRPSVLDGIRVDLELIRSAEATAGDAAAAIGFNGAAACTYAIANPHDPLTTPLVTFADAAVALRACLGPSEPSGDHDMENVAAYFATTCAVEFNAAVKAMAAIT